MDETNRNFAPAPPPATTAPRNGSMTGGTGSKADTTEGNMKSDTSYLEIGVAAGLAGALVEILWVASYAPMVGVDPTTVAGEVTATLLPAARGLPSAVQLGLAIHMALGAALGLVIAQLRGWLRPQSHGALCDYAAVVFLLVGVWTANFFFVLPALNPGFVELLPYAGSFVSKVLFGLAAAVVLRAWEERHVGQAQKIGAGFATRVAGGGDA